MADLEKIISGAETIRSRRKTLALQVNEEGRLVVRAPLRCPNAEISRFIEKSRKWIENRVEKAALRNLELERSGTFSQEDIKAMTEKALEIIPGRVKLYAEKLGVTYGKIRIRCQKTKWGSCSAKGDLNFNCLLTAAPPEILDSVVAHELCHRLHMDHSKAFYAELRRVFPNYEECGEWLKKNGVLLIRRAAGAKKTGGKR